MTLNFAYFYHACIDDTYKQLVMETFIAQVIGALLCKYLGFRFGELEMTGKLLFVLSPAGFCRGFQTFDAFQVTCQPKPERDCPGTHPQQEPALIFLCET